MTTNKNKQVQKSQFFLTITIMLYYYESQTIIPNVSKVFNFASFYDYGCVKMGYNIMPPDNFLSYYCVYSPHEKSRVKTVTATKWILTKMNTSMSTKPQTLRWRRGSAIRLNGKNFLAIHKLNIKSNNHKKLHYWHGKQWVVPLFRSALLIR